MGEKSETTRVLGVADYEAHWIGRSFMVRLTAIGILPCANYKAQLEMRPERIMPPMWNMVFFQEDYCMKALRPFKVEAIMLNVQGSETINVTDATGENLIPIQDQLSPQSNKESLVSAADADQYVVYAKLPQIGDTHHGCIVVPSDFLVTAIYYRSFGPAPRAECDAFASENCGVVDLLELESLRGGEIPWPLLE